MYGRIKKLNMMKNSRIQGMKVFILDYYTLHYSYFLKKHQFCHLKASLNQKFTNEKTKPDFVKNRENYSAKVAIEIIIITIIQKYVRNFNIISPELKTN